MDSMLALPLPLSGLLQFRASLLVGAILALLLSTSASARACEISLSYEHWPPYFDAQGEVPYGLEVDLIEAILAEADCSATWHDVNWKRSLQFLKSGELDGMTGASITEERRQFARFTVPYRKEVFSIFVHKSDGDDFPGTDLREVVGKMSTVGLVRGFYAGPELEAVLNDEQLSRKISYTHTDTLNFKQLLAGRLDAVISDRLVGFEIARELNAGAAVQLHPLSVHENDVHIMLSRKSVSPATVQRLNEAIARLQRTGDLERIVHRYLAIQ